MYKIEYSKRFIEIAHDIGKNPANKPLVEKVLDFKEKVEKWGISNKKHLPGKLVPTWNSLPFNHERFNYAADNNLWHYHIGFPNYTVSNKGFSTSKWLIHFIWNKESTSSEHYEIKIVDLHPHSDENGNFYVPPILK